MTTLRSAAEMALEALDNVGVEGNWEREEAAVVALRAALEPVPVAWMDREGDLYKMPEIEGWAPPHTLLYTHPPQQQAAPFSPDSISTAQTAWKMGYEAAKAEIAEQPEQKPVAIVVAAEYEDGSHAGHRLEWRGRNEANDYPEGTEFYTAPPPQRKPLTNEELDALAIDEDGLPNSHFEFARAIERAHGIGGKE